MYFLYIYTYWITLQEITMVIFVFESFHCLQEQHVKEQRYKVLLVCQL